VHDDSTKTSRETKLPQELYTSSIPNDLACISIVSILIDAGLQQRQGALS